MTQTTLAAQSYSRRINLPLQLVAATLLGVLILYGVGFSSTTEAHNAAHDTRHASGFPCH